METAVLQSGDYKPASGQKMKARAPPPPNQPPIDSKVNNEVTPALGKPPDQTVLHMKENLINRTVDFVVIFPDGEEQKNIVHGSKAVMDLLVDLCSQRHLNPAHYTLELQSLETQQPLSYKPNTMIGALDVQKIFLKGKVYEGKTKRPPPKIPEKTIRLVVNYLKTQKTVVRVNPEVPLQSIIPVICEKCEVSEEYLVLLKDIFTGEKLELTKSLNELGIKELYAWNRKRALPSKTQSEPSLHYRETKNASTNSDTTEKERKRFFGFFKTSKKNSKAEESSRTSIDWDGGEPLKSIMSSKQSLDGAMATSDSSDNLCSLTVVPSLSLGNISRVTASTEIKKRRAPPLPVILSFPGREADGEEKIPSKLSQSSLQHELKKKKRRAPPPPTPATPTRREEMEDKRQSTVGNGRQVPQKPPRGNTRGPPQLVIPPPPPYPPPDTDTMDPTVLYSEADVTDPTLLVSKRNILLSHTCTAEAIEETTSVNSSFMSEGNIVDSEVMHLPSDTVSLDFQNDSISLEDKSIDVKEIDFMLGAEVCSVKNAFLNSDESEDIQQRNDDRMMKAKFENADKFLDVHMQKTQPVLGEDLTVMEDKYDSKSKSVFTEMNGTCNSLQQNAQISDVAFPVPVTIIDEVPENYITICSSSEEKNILLSKTEVNENISDHSIGLDKLITENNNIASVSNEYIDGASSYLSWNFSQQFEEIMDQEQKCEAGIHTFSYEKENKTDGVQKNIFKNCTDSKKPNTWTIAENLKLPNKVNGIIDKVRPLNEKGIIDEHADKLNDELKNRLISTKADKNKTDPTQSLRFHFVNNGTENYEPKTGLTTFKVVPPKPQVKHFDRDVSLCTGAIKIDELGNLVSPNIGIRKITVNMTSREVLIGRDKALWKLNSMEKQTEQSSVGHSVNPAITNIIKQSSKRSRTKPDCIIGLEAGTLPIVGHSAENIVGPEKTKLPIHITHFTMKTLLAPVVNRDRKDLLFQKPQRKTSNHYFATTIAKCNDPTQFITSQERQNKEEELNKGIGIKTEIEPLFKGCVVEAKHCLMEAEPVKAKDPCSATFNCSKNVSKTQPYRTDSRITNKASNMKPLSQNKPTNDISGSFTLVLSNDESVTEEEAYYRSAQDTTEKEKTSLVNQMKRPHDQVSSPSCVTKLDGDSSSTMVSCSMKSNRGNHFNSIPSEGNDTFMVSQTISEEDEKFDNAGNEVYSNITKDNICNIFGPKKKFKSVIQKPLPKDTSLHSALMEAIQTAGGRDKLRKISHNTVNGTQKSKFTEPETERSALLAAIRGHRGISRLRKISSSASDELQRFRNAEVTLQDNKISIAGQHHHSPPPSPQPPVQLVMEIPGSFPGRQTDDPEDSRQALLEAIRSGAGTARLRKVPLFV